MEFLQQTEQVKPKRGRPRKEIKKIDCIEIEEKIVLKPKHDLSSYEIKKVSFSDTLPNVIEGVGIQIDKNTNQTILSINQDFNSKNLNEWKKGIGGIYNRDCKHFIKNPELEFTYFLFEHSDDIFLTKLLSDDEIILTKDAEFNLFEFNHNTYAIIKFLPKDYKLSCNFSFSKNANILCNTTEFLDDELIEDIEDEQATEENEINF